MALSIGQKAPEFKLYNSELKEVALSDYAGKNLVVHFFPLAFIGMCTTQLIALRDSFHREDTLTSGVLAISVDSPFTLARFKEENHFPFQLLSDFNKKVSRDYGAFYEEFVFGLEGVSKCAVFVINRTQEIIYAEILESAGELPDYESIVRAAESF